MESNRSYNPEQIRLAGALSIFAGLLYLASLFYVLVILNSAGLKLEMFEDTKVLLKWISRNNFYYKILWIINFLMAVFLLPVPSSVSKMYRHKTPKSSAYAASTHLIGSCGVILILISSIVLFSVSPVTANAFAKGQQMALITHETAAVFAMQLRLFGSLLISFWLASVGVFIIRKKPLEVFGWFLIILFILTFFVAAGKAFNIFDWEPFLGIIMAFSYIWFGRELRLRVR